MTETEKLEEQIAHLARIVDDLNEVVTRQSGDIARLEKQLAALIRAEADRQSDGAGGVVLGDERPPHY